mgnify:FL=1
MTRTTKRSQRSFKQLQIHVLRSLQRNSLALIPLGAQH